jgi:hypothetical protein
MRLACAVIAVLFAACVAGPEEETGSEAGGKADGSGSGHQLPGFDETLLVGAGNGALSVVHVGETFGAKPVALRTSQPPSVIRAKDGRFYALFDSGKLAVIDATTAKVERSLSVGSRPRDIEWWSETELAVSRGSGIDTIDLATGTKTSSLDLASLRIGTGSVQTRRLLRVDERLFVQVARTRADGRPENGALAVVRNGSVEKVIELDGLNPDFALVHDARRGHLYVTCAGVRPSNTGVLVRIDTATLAVHDRIPAESGWQGIVAFAEPFETLFMLYHTSTPTTSSHLFAFSVDDSGALADATEGGAIVDAFDGLDALAINDSGTLVAMANHCLVGFCIGGAGINFIDVATREKQPKLLKATLGFEPVIVELAR